MIFENPRAFLLLLVLPFLLFGLGFSGWKAKKGLAEFFRLDLQPLRRGQITKYGTAGLLMLFLVGALALPKIPLSSSMTPRKTGEILLLVDVSASMAAQQNERSLNRLARVKPVLYELIDKMDQLGEVKLSLCMFTSIARSLAPFVDREDYPYIKESIRRVLAIHSTPGEGSIFGRSLLNVLGKFSKDQGVKLIVLFSDGEAFIGLSRGIHDVERNFLKEAIAKATKDGIKVITVGIGEREGAKIPLYDNGKFSGEYAKLQGADYVSNLEEEILRQIASQTGGRYFFEKDRKGLIQFIEQNLAVATSKEVVSQLKVYRPVAYWFILASLPLWVFFVRRYLL
jgi:Ca-activated chloride channel homolog